MIALLLVATTLLSPAPVMYAAQARSIAYRDCVATEHGRRPAAVAEIGRRACARERSRLVADVRDHVSFGWAATAKTGGQARRLRAQLKVEAEARVADFESKLQSWLAETENAGGSR